MTKAYKKPHKIMFMDEWWVTEHRQAEINIILNTK